MSAVPAIRPAPRAIVARIRRSGRGVLGHQCQPTDAPSEMASYGRTCAINFPLLKVPGNVVADQFAAERVPEVFVLDKERKICYRGRIDDQFGLSTGSGYARPKVRSRDLASALEETLAGKKVSHPVTEASGCLIGRVTRVAPHGEILTANTSRGCSRNIASSAIGPARSRRSRCWSTTKSRAGRP